MLRKIRVSLGILVLALVTLVFLDFTGTMHSWFGWLTRIQFMPAFLAVNAVIVIALLVFTFLFGRLYCSVICPLGLFQDAASRAAGRFKKKNRFSYSPSKSWLRYIMFAVFLVAFAAGVSVIYTILEPYSAFGRMASNLFAPVYQLGNNILAYFAERVDSYAVYPVEVRVKSWITFGIAVLTFLAVGLLAWRGGRTYCNTICPVGTLLGFVSKFSLLRPVIDPEKCTKCGLCSKNCKASCIEHKEYRIDHSRCVTCYNCLDKCKFDALHYTMKKPAKKIAPAPAEEPTADGNEGVSRRGFLTIAGMMAASQVLRSQAPVVDGGLAVIEDKKTPDRKNPVLPPGALGIHHLSQHCTACQLCVSVCPNDILVPSNSLKRFMQPEMSFNKGYCRPECVKCSEVCPNGAIKRITDADKSSIQIGRAYWIEENCVVLRDEETCTACERHCPTDAIELIQREGSPEGLKTPVIDLERCIGCGACEHLCPARPFSAIYVEGNQRHITV